MTYNPAGPEANVESNAHFALEVDGLGQVLIEKYSFSDCKHSVIEGRAGTDGPTKQTSAGLQDVVTITIEKKVRTGEVGGIKTLVDWYKRASKDKRGGSVIVLNDDGERLYSYDFRDGWVSNWKPPDGDASADADPLAHTFEITVPEISFKE